MVVSFAGTVAGVTDVARVLNQAEERSLDAAAQGTARGVLLGQSIVRGKASGRPGPRVRTGDFRRSIVGDSERRGSTIFGQIGTNAAQGRRLEYGFFGPDRLGRVYAQPPYAYMEPSVPEVRDAVVEQITAAIEGAI